MRLDQELTARGLFPSRAKAAAAVADGRVRVNGQPVLKNAFPVSGSDRIDVDPLPENEIYVSRAGLKLAAALDAFGVSPAGKTVLDIGASTGGFTDCLLRRGASYVYAVDVGTGQLDPSLRTDERVCSMEKTNARYLTASLFGRKPDMAVMDVSFISQSLLYPALAPLLPPGGFLISLVKPQFEVGPDQIGKNGIVRDPDGRKFRKILDKLKTAAASDGLTLRQWTDSPIAGGDGNREYLALFQKEI